MDSISNGHPVVFISNHPFGIVDGLILCNIATLLCGDFKILINGLLCQDRDLARHFLPVDFATRMDAKKCNTRTKKIALESLSSGIPIAIFPSGTVSTANKFGFGQVVEAPWTTFAAKLIRESKATVEPVYFYGRNSRGFHIASHLVEPLRMGLLTREALHQFGRRGNLVIGSPIAFHRINTIESRNDLTHYLYSQVQELALAS